MVNRYQGTRLGEHKPVLNLGFEIRFLNGIQLDSGGLKRLPGSRDGLLNMVPRCAILPVVRNWSSRTAH